MPAPDLSSFKVAVSETSSATKFNNLVQAIQDEFADIDPDQIPGYPGDSTKFLRGDGAWAVPPLGSWAAWTPTLTAATTNPTMGTNPTQSGRYVQIGKTVIGHFQIVMGNPGFSAGSGEYRISTPVTPASASVHVGAGWIFNGSGVRPALWELGAGAYFVGRTDYGATGTGPFSHADPWAWANGYIMHGHFAYEAA